MTASRQSTVAIIPARGGSQGLPNKNLQRINGRPMIEYSIEAAHSAKEITAVIVSTDSDAIERCARVAGAEVFRHPPELSADDARTFPVIQWDVRTLVAQGRNPDLIAVLRATSPFRTAHDIDAAVRTLRARPDADSLLSVVEHPGAHPRRLKFVDKDGWIIDAFEPEGFFPTRRQELDTVYIRTGGIYLAPPEVIEAGGLWGARCLAYVMPPERSLNINSAYDVKLAELIARFGAEVGWAVTPP